ncbi:MAG TPA: response regulator, partial [Gemmatimonadaceae bacterium]|nr:response regulator [Gemmatimonadaceae bacterium]
DATPAAGGGAEADAAPARGRATVLLVEDDSAIRTLAHRILAANGYTVIDAGSGERALALAAEHASGGIQLLLTDVVLSGMNGRELADRLRVSHPRMRVLYMSGYTDDAVIHRGVTDPTRGLLAKPFTANELTRKVAEVLSRPEPDRGAA